MGVYIKNMEMPKEIEPALVIDFCEDPDGKRYARFYHYRYGGLTDWHEFLEFPEPHGRLIDADTLIETMARMAPLAITDPTANTFLDGLSAAYKAIQAAPTIIEAEEGEI